MKKLIFAAATCFAALQFSAAHAAIIFTDWTSIDTTTDTAAGTLGPIGVTLAGGNILSGDTSGSSTVFNHSFFTPALATSDVVEILGPNPALTFTYLVNFSSPVTNPRMHISSLASTLTFSSGVTKLSGQSDFSVAGNTVTGVLHDTGTDVTDSNGTIELGGTFSSFTFTAQATQTFLNTGDGIEVQIGADIAAVPLPGSGWLLLAGLGLLGLSRRNYGVRTHL